MLWRPGRRLLTTAGILMLLTAAAHTAGHFSPSAGPAEDAVLAAMDGYRIPLGMGMTPSFLDIFRGLSLTMAIAFVALGSITLVVSASDDAGNALVRRLVWTNVLWVGAFGLLMFRYRVLPPLICAVVIEAALVGALGGSRSGSPVANPSRSR